MHYNCTPFYRYREEEAIKLDGLSVAQLKELREGAEKQTFQAEVDRMMKLIINSLYKNKEVSIGQVYATPITQYCWVENCMILVTASFDWLYTLS